MIPGIIAAAGVYVVTGGGGGSIDPDGIMLDFENSTYGLNGSAVAITDLLEQNTDYATWPSSPAWAAGEGAVLKSAVAAPYLSAGATLIVDFEPTTGSDYIEWFASGFSTDTYLELDAGPKMGVNTPGESGFDGSFGSVSARARFAGTYLPAGYEGSLNGGTVISHMTFSNALLGATVIGIFNTAAVIKKIRIIAPAATADLPTLSTLPP